MEPTAGEIKEEEIKDFSGNYIDKFESQNSREKFPGEILSWEKRENTFTFHGKYSSLAISIISTDILKFRYGNDGYFEDDFSYAIDPEIKYSFVNYKFEELKATYVIKTTNLRCYINKEDLNIRISNSEGVAILQDEKGYHWEDHPAHGGTVNFCTKLLHKEEKFYGLGDKTGSLLLNNTKKELWGTDCYGYGNDSDPVYKNIPFFMGQHSKIGYGVFMDNTFRSFFDFGHERKEAFSFWNQGGEMRYYFIYGPQLIDVIKKYAFLTGTPKLPPKWSLGYHQSKWSYYPESVVRKLGKDFRSKKIPCDVIHLDIDYMDGFRCFTWDKSRFPKPKKMIADLKKQGFKTVVIIDPGIKVDKGYSIYRQGIENDYFCRRMDGALLKASVWPGECHFPDFTKKEVRKWWTTLYEGLMDDGIDGVWNDMNEPATFEEGTFPIDVRHDFDGHDCSHRKAHNVYGSLMAQSTHDGQKLFMSEKKRPFTITRSGYAGVQRFASVWTGDNSASWEHLRIANIQCQRLSASGVSFVGSDIGGFIGSPNGELYTRWIQMAVFHPFFRTHSSGDHGDKEPWTFDDIYLNIVRRYIEMRYKLLPYIYSSFYQHIATGLPMIRSLHLVGHDDPDTFYREEEFLLGDHFLVCPVSKEGAVSRKMYLPKGKWYNYWSNELMEGTNEIEVYAPLDIIPIFVKAGAVIPEQPAMQYVDEFVFESLRLNLYMPYKETSSELYEDSGDGYEYLDEYYSLKNFKSYVSNNYWHIEQSVTGQYVSTYKSYEAVFYGLKMMPSSIMVDGNEMMDEAEYRDEKVILKLNKNFNSILINQS